VYYKYEYGLYDHHLLHTRYVQAMIRICAVVWPTCRALYTKKPPDIPLVEAELIIIELPEDHHLSGRGPCVQAALVMRTYAITVTKLLPVSPKVILREGRRMQQAVSYIHSRGYLHMDIKVCITGNSM
jgi:hypothetical protein